MFLRSFKTRITLLFTLVFIVCSAVLFFVAYLIVSSSLESEQRALLKSRLLEFYALYQSSDIDMVGAEMTLERMYRDERVYMLRIAGRLNDTRLLYVPPGWQDFPFSVLESGPSPSEAIFITLKNPKSGEELEISSLFLPDGNLLQIGISNAQKERTLARFRSAFLLTLIPLALASALIGLFLASRFLRPVEKLTRITRKISATGKIEQRIPARSGGDELAELVVLFNNMLARIESLIAGMRDNLDHVAHDIRTPLTRLRGAVETALKSKSDPAALKAAIKNCLEESEHILSLLSTLLEISQADSGITRLDRSKTDLAVLLADLVEFYQYPAQEKSICLTSEITGPLAVNIDANRMRQVFSNILENALKYTPAGKTVTLVALAEDKRAVVRIADTGRGIAGDELPFVFTRFYRGRESRKEPGFGLGLYLAKKIIEAHEGSIAVESVPNEGSRFTISLPLASTNNYITNL